MSWWYAVVCCVLAMLVQQRRNHLQGAHGRFSERGLMLSLQFSCSCYSYCVCTAASEAAAPQGTLPMEARHESGMHAAAMLCLAHITGACTATAQL
jgi:hypothetical protein